MKKIIFVLGILIAFGISNLYAHSDVRVSFGFFYRSLAPYGEWIEIEPDFYVWKPIAIRYGWRPYWDGRWVWTRFGWYWVSYEPFGWIVFHYGRWYFDDYYGWIWIPGYEWAPAWVEWRYNDSYIGWAPLPPYASFRIGVGIYFTKKWHHPVHHWVFIKYKHFHRENPTRYYEDSRRVERFFGNTRQAIDYRFENDRIINRGVEPTYIEQKTGRRIKQAEIIETQNRRGERILFDSDRPRIEIYRPNLDEIESARQERIEARRSERRLNIDLNQIDRQNYDERRTRKNYEREAEFETRERKIEEQKFTRETDRKIERKTETENRTSQRESYRVRPERKFEEDKQFERKREFRPERREREIEIKRERLNPREDRSEPIKRERTRERDDTRNPTRERQR